MQSRLRCGGDGTVSNINGGERMRRIICTMIMVLAMCLFMPWNCVTAKAADDMTFSFEITLSTRLKPKQII